MCNVRKNLYIIAYQGRIYGKGAEGLQSPEISEICFNPRLNMSIFRRIQKFRCTAHIYPPKTDKVR